MQSFFAAMISIILSLQDCWPAATLQYRTMRALDGSIDKGYRYYICFEERGYCKVRQSDSIFVLCICTCAAATTVPALASR